MITIIMDVSTMPDDVLLRSASFVVRRIRQCTKGRMTLYTEHRLECWGDTLLRECQRRDRETTNVKTS